MSYSGTRVKHQNIPEGTADNGKIRKFLLEDAGRTRGDVGAHILMEEVTPEVMIVTIVMAMQAGSPLDLKFF
ncbi:hypothetical protein FF1_010658 [Malus domestica]